MVLSRFRKMWSGIVMKRPVRGSSSETEISLAKFLILSFTRSMIYNVLSICSTNHFSGFSSIFLQMKREVDRKSNMLFCDCYREHY